MILQVGGWKEEFAEFPEMQAEVQGWVEKQMAASKVPFR